MNDFQESYYPLDRFELYNLARKFRQNVYKLIKKLPKEEKYGLDPQMRRAIISVTNNIAEGHGRWYYQENIRFCRTDSTHVLAAIRTLTRLEWVVETLIHTLNVLAPVAPDGLKSLLPRDWFTKSERTLDEYRLPQEKKEREIFTQMIGVDGHHRLDEIYAKTAPDFLRGIPAVQTMRDIFIQQYYLEQGEVFWRDKGNLPSSATMISSPHDTDARYSSKRKILVKFDNADCELCESKPKCTRSRY